MSPAGDREFDLVLAGASGFVGRLTARHLAQYAPDGLRIALAGRSRERLAGVREDLGPVARAWPLIRLDAQDETATAELASRTRVLGTTIGPYLRHGLPLVGACAAAGTHYADLSGETIFVRRSIDAHHRRAQTTGAKIVHSCGFDSVPSDLGVGLNDERAAAEGQGQLANTVLHLRSAAGGLSGGTIDSLRQQILEASGDDQLRALLASSRAMTDHWVADSPRERPAGRRRRRFIDRDPGTGHWQAPFVMGGYNRQVVARSRELIAVAPDDAFRYREVVDTGVGLTGAAVAAAVGLGSMALLAGMWFRPTRRLLDVVLPDPGQGPSQQTRTRGRFLVEVVSETTTGARYRTRIGAGQDPGYDGTAVMLGESLCCLALDELPERAGVLTPMAAMGARLAERLRGRGFTVLTERLAEPGANGTGRTGGWGLTVG